MYIVLCGFSGYARTKNYVRDLMFHILCFALIDVADNAWRLGLVSFNVSCVQSTTFNDSDDAHVPVFPFQSLIFFGVQGYATRT